MVQSTRKRGLLSKGRLFFYLFSLLVFFFVVYYFSEIRQGFNLLRKFNGYWVLLAFVLQLLTYLLNAFIYRVLLQIYRVPVVPSLKEFYKASVVSLFFNQTLPSAGISGNTFLFNYLEKKSIASPLVISLILLELLSFYAAIEFTITLFIAVSFWNRWPYIFYSVLLAGFLVYLLFGIAVILAGRKKVFDVLYKKLAKKKLFKSFFQRFGPGVESRNTDRNPIELISILKTRPLALTKAFFLQLLLFTTDLFTIVILFKGLGVPVPLLSVALSLLCTKIISLLPFSPGALILYESSMTFFFVKLGIALGPSVMITLIFRLLSFWLPIPAGLLLYRQWLHERELNIHTHYGLS